MALSSCNEWLDFNLKYENKTKNSISFKEYFITEAKKK